MSQAELVRRTGIRSQTVSDLYHEINISISMNNLDKICEILGCGVGEIFVYIPSGKLQKSKSEIE